MEAADESIVSEFTSRQPIDVNVSDDGTQRYVSGSHSTTNEERVRGTGLSRPPRIYGERVRCLRLPEKGNLFESFRVAVGWNRKEKEQANTLGFPR